MLCCSTLFIWNPRFYIVGFGVWYLFSVCIVFLSNCIDPLFSSQEKLYQWILRQQEEGSRATTVDIVAYLQVCVVISCFYILWIEHCDWTGSMLRYHLKCHPEVIVSYYLHNALHNKLITLFYLILLLFSFSPKDSIIEGFQI